MPESADTAETADGKPGQQLPIVREEFGSPELFKNRLAFVLHNILSQEECARVVATAEVLGFKRATVKTGFKTVEYQPDHREGENCYVVDAEIRELLLSRVRDHLPKEFRFGRLVGLNERLTVLRYRSGGFFGEHTDGTVIAADDSAISFITIQLYLNEGFEGGETVFFPDGPARQNCPADERRRVAVTPRTGSAVVFEHKILHAGGLVRSGTKLTLRADVLYTRYYPPDDRTADASTDTAAAAASHDALSALQGGRPAASVWSSCVVQ